jgi:hypothetical protein
MALGFRDCCNEFNYFLLKDTPGTVSEYEVYLIETNEGPTFCGTYLNLPPLNYTPTTYNAVNLSQQADCNTCIGLNPCPVEENILENQFGPGSVIIQPDCNFTSIRYLLVDCFPVNPTFENSLDGEVILNITGGVPPYVIRDFYTNQVLQGEPTIDNFYRVLNGVPAGDYRFLVSDTDENFILDITCTLTAPPPFPVFTAQTIDASVFGKPDGQIDLIVLSAGTPPYGYIINGIVYDTLPIIIGAGTYTIIIFDEYYTTELEVTVEQPPPVDYPSQLCFNAFITTVPGCSQTFGITFERFVNYYDYRAQYFALNPEIIGFGTLNLRYEESVGGWVILPEFWNASPQFSSPCFVALLPIGNIGFRKLDGTTDTPDGDWESTETINFSNVVISAGFCKPIATIEIIGDICESSPSVLGVVTIGAEGGSGPPYKFYVSNNTGFSVVSNIPSIGNLNDGSYSAIVSDSQNNFSDPVTFTVSITPAYVFTSTQLLSNQCNRTSQTTFFQNVVPGGNAARVDPGESIVSQVTSRTTFNFSFLPNGVSLNLRFRATVSWQLRVASGIYTNPDLYFSVGNTRFIKSNVTTNGVTTDFLNGVAFTVSPSPAGSTIQVGTWWRWQNGSATCCPTPLTVNGAAYGKQRVWFTNFITVNNTTVFDIEFFNEMINSIPYTDGIVGCTVGCGNGFMNSGLNFEFRQASVNGCGRVNVGSSEFSFTSYGFRQTGNGTFGGAVFPGGLTRQCP